MVSGTGQERSRAPVAFSPRVPYPLVVNAVTDAVARARKAGVPLLDLTVSNPTSVGLAYSPMLVTALATTEALTYRPSPFGLAAARQAIARDLGRHDAAVAPDRVVLTASTSEAYSFLLKLFCAPTDDVVVPAPSYPLFEHLCRLEGVTTRPYRLDYHGVWSIDLDSLSRAVTPRTRAVLVVAPNNPTGSLLRRADWDALCAFCADRGLPLICDEVFLDYLIEPAPDAVRGVLSREAATDVLVVALGGLSKSVGLPQHKLAWMVFAGDASMVDVALERLELICDTYLSVGTPVQAAAPELLRAGAGVRAAIVDRIARNATALRARVGTSPACEMLRVEGGWSAVLRVPATRPEEILALELIEHDGVLVQPGFFYDFESEAYLVVSLLPQPDVFDAAIDRVCRRAER